MIVPAIEVEQAYRACEQITRREAGNFFYGIRLLPREKRDAMSAVYAFARRVDDIGDGELPRRAKLALLRAERRHLEAIANPRAARPLDPITVALSHAWRTFELPLDALELLIDSVELDVNETRYATYEELVVYCRGVAGSIGRLCLAIFLGPRRGSDEVASALADELGVAMQLTNILRDIREDQDRGRVYLPAEDRRAFGCEDLSDERVVSELIKFEAGRARAAFDHGLELVTLLDQRSASCLQAMTGIYTRILARIEADPGAVLRGRISLTGWEKSRIAARSLIRTGVAA